MPNWCNNRLEVSGDKEYLDTLEAAANSGELFDTIKPIGDWVYETAIQAWGTKWDVADVGVDRVGDNDIVFHFDSAWSPPIGVYEALGENTKVTDVFATYFEPGMGFTGKWDNGNDIFYEDIPALIKSNAMADDSVLEELNEEYGFADWYEEEVEELSQWMDDGVKARQVAHDV